ncbi:3'-5'-exoribonuclease [Leucoagaricus gongylophorus]
MRPSSPSIPEKEFVYASLKEFLRLDGRSLLEQRKVEISFGRELGYVECNIGKTRVIAQVDAKMVKPSPERQYEGIISIHSEISSMASNEYEIGRCSDEEVAITRMLDKVLRRSDAIDKESLCILVGHRVWHLRLTLHFLADDGNMLDCACLAGITAFRHFRRPEVEVIGDEIITHPASERAPVPLAIHHMPFCFTFAFFPEETIPPVLDPSQLEQDLSASLLSIVLNAQKEICVLQKLGGAPLPGEEILRLVNVSVEKAREFYTFIESRLTEDWLSRKVEVR